MCKVTITFCGSCQNTVHSVRYDEVCSPNCKPFAEVHEFNDKECFICQAVREQMATSERRWETEKRRLQTEDEAMEVDNMMRKLSISKKGAEKGAGWGNEDVEGMEVDDMMGGLRISDKKPQEAAGDGEEDVGRMMGAMRISDAARRERRLDGGAGGGG